VLDFSESDRYSPLWELKREFVFEQLEEDNLLKLKTLRQGLHAAACSYGDGELYKHHFEKSTVEIKGVGELLFPWIDWESDPKAEEYKKMWEEWYGVKVGSAKWEELEREGEVLYDLYKKGRNSRGKKVIE
jgi:hypothetical protein